jgi:hypothetical protein
MGAIINSLNANGFQLSDWQLVSAYRRSSVCKWGLIYFAPRLPAPQGHKTAVTRQSASCQCIQNSVTTMQRASEVRWLSFAAEQRSHRALMHMQPTPGAIARASCRTAAHQRLRAQRWCVRSVQSIDNNLTSTHSVDEHATARPPTRLQAWVLPWGWRPSSACCCWRGSRAAAAQTAGSASSASQR